jgi:hypothetical protein
MKSRLFPKNKYTEKGLMHKDLSSYSISPLSGCFPSSLQI